MSKSPRSGDVSPRTPTALRTELAAAKRAVEVLKAEKSQTEEKLEKMHAVLEKERNALKDVLAQARARVDTLQDDCKTKDEEIERLKALLGDQQPNNSMHGEMSRSMTNMSEDAELARLRQQLERQLTVNKEQAQRMSDMQRAGGDKEALMKQLTSLREQLQSQSKLFSEQMEASRKREEELRSQLVKQRQDSNTELGELRTQLAKALENENAFKVEQLERGMSRLRREVGLRMVNAFLRSSMAVSGASSFHFWRLVTSQNNAEKKLSSEARFRLESARAKADGRSLFGDTPLAHKTHMQTRQESFDSHRYELWENMTPRGGRGDGRDGSLSQSPRSSPASSPARVRPPKFGTGLGMGGAVGRSLNIH